MMKFLQPVDRGFFTKVNPKIKAPYPDNEPLLAFFGDTPFDEMSTALQARMKQPISQSN